MNYKAVWKPLPGSQSLSLSCPCNEILYEGTRGPGKTAAQLARFRRLVGLGYGSFWRGVIFDTEYKNLTDIITQSKRMYRLFNDGARYLASASELRWVWPTGEELLFRFGKEEGDYWDYHGQEFPFIGFNELTKQQSAEFYEMMFSCRRSSFRPENYPLDDGSLLKPIPLETFSTTNPFGIGHTWVKKRFIEPAPRGTIIRETQKVFNPQTEREEDVTLTRVAIHGSFKENPYLDPQYIATLMAIKDPNRRKAWVEGSWDVTSGGRFDHLWNASLHVIKPFRIPDSWTVDRSHDWGESKPFSNLWWARADGTVESRTIQAVNGQQLILATAFTAEPLPNAIFVIDAGQLSLQYFRVTNLTFNDEENTYSITGAEYNGAKYDAVDNNARLDTPPVSLIPTGLVGQPKNITISSYDSVRQGQRIATLVAGWDAPLDKNGKPQADIVAYQTQWKRGDNEWINIPETGLRNIEVPGIFSGDYLVRVRAINSGGASSLWASSVLTNLTGRTGDVPKPVGLRTTAINWGIQVDWSFPADTGDTLQTELQYSVNGNGDNPLLLAGVPYPQHTYTQLGLKAGVEFWYRARLVDRIGNQSDWTDWVRGESNANADDYLGDIADDFLTSADGDRLTGDIDTNLEAILQNALANHGTVEHQFAQYGEVRADILVVKTTIADVDQAMAEMSTQVQAQFNGVTAALEDKLTAVVDATGASAIYTLKTGVRINGVMYNAGMSIAVLAEAGKPVVTRVGFNANQFVLMSGSGDTQYSPFAVVNGQVFISDAFIQYGQITLAKIGELRSANYVQGKTGTIMKSDGSFEVNGAVAGEGAMRITNTTQSVKDGNGVLRVQIGKITGVF